MTRKKNIPMPSFKVLHLGFNAKQIEFYDVIPYLIEQCENKFKSKKDLLTLGDWSSFVEFIRGEAMYIWWARCEYECLISDANETKPTKIDWYWQILTNLDLISYEIYRYLIAARHIIPTFAFKCDELIGYKDCFNIIYVNPETCEPDHKNIIPYLMEYFLKRYDNTHYNFKDFAELEGLVSNALEEEYSRGTKNKIFILDWPNESFKLKTTSFEIALQNIEMLCRVFYNTYENYFKKFLVEEVEAAGSHEN